MGKFLPLTMQVRVRVSHATLFYLFNQSFFSSFFFKVRFLRLGLELGLYIFCYIYQNLNRVFIVYTIRLCAKISYIA